MFDKFKILNLVLKRKKKQCKKVFVKSCDKKKITLEFPKQSNFYICTESLKYQKLVDKN